MDKHNNKKYKPMIIKEIKVVITRILLIMEIPTIGKKDIKNLKDNVINGYKE